MDELSMRTLLDALRATVFRRSLTVPEIADRLGVREGDVYKAAAPHETTGTVGHRSLAFTIRLMEASSPRPVLEYLARRFGYRLRKARRRAAGVRDLADHFTLLADWQKAVAEAQGEAAEGRDLTHLEELAARVQNDVEDIIAGLHPQPSLPLEEDE